MQDLRNEGDARRSGTLGVTAKVGKREQWYDKNESSVVFQGNFGVFQENNALLFFYQLKRGEDKHLKTENISIKHINGWLPC